MQDYTKPQPTPPSQQPPLEQTPQPAHPVKGQNYAGFFPRFVALIIDAIILWIAFFIAQMFLQNVVGLDALSSAQSATVYAEQNDNTLAMMESIYAGQSNGLTIGILIQLLIAIPYYVLFVSGKKQATPGKMVMNIYIQSKDGARLKMEQAFLRYFIAYWWVSVLTLLLGGGLFITGLTGFALSAQLFISLIMVLTTAEKITVHDSLAKTRVVKGKL